MGSNAVAAAPGFRRILDRILAVSRPVHPLEQDAAAVVDAPAAGALAFFLGHAEPGGPLLSPTVTAGAEVAAGQALGKLGPELLQPSPVAGTVAGIRQMPDVRGGKPGLAVLLTPAGSGEAAFAPLDGAAASAEELQARWRESGLARDLPSRAETVIILAADAEPGISSSVCLLLEDPAAAVRAARIVARAAGARRTVLAVLEAHAGALRDVAARSDVEIRALRAEYPATLPAAVARAAAGAGAADTGAGPAVVGLADARAALDAAETGRVPASRIVTVLGAGGAPVGNFRVALGTRIGDLLGAAGVEVSPGDQVLTGGRFRGLGQYSLDAAVDRSVDAVTVVKAGSLPAWSDEPCVNCGNCLDACPEGLQAHHLARFAEFGLFDRTPEHGLHDCIECGLCATVCPARRPLLQRIRLAKREVAATGRRMAAASADAPDPAEPDPIPVPVAAGGKE